MLYAVNIACEVNEYSGFWNSSGFFKFKAWAIAVCFWL
ncbi:hypothetical protein AB895_0011 [Acinetobacter baumannii]|nr:hypothetical protein J463_3248 [Acinetobacter baumannii 1043794]EXD90356.1 hypothetical protein J462_2306 [Acinetobacter baumannii 972082]EXE92025.1 hypothetical protein J593_3406 [Acinetobacter baumannii 232184]EXF06340.1 hypothetical protein J600_3415 [Acinetobacter baumannii 268680]EXG95817.1 hypothetical protein J649_3194 [Acinetobacter baumannii 1064293_45]KCX15922.1 hypothetical protein J723_1957 [Acinetobacter sp. 1264765]KMV07375.1 hypothetical protein AB895_0011 [Acinetobacter bau